MKAEYDFSKSQPNPYAKLLKKEVKLKIDEYALLYFKNLAQELGIPYQNLINSYLRDCVQHNRKPAVKWA
jgi:predicted DNA binding CopG/RHH family protein